MVEPCGNGRVLAEILAQPQSVDYGPGGRKCLCDLPRSVATAIFDEDDLKAWRDLLEDGCEPAQQLVQASFGIRRWPCGCF
jgi:hypothetical protein